MSASSRLVRLAMITLTIAAQATAWAAPGDGAATASAASGTPACPDVNDVWRAAKVLMGRTHRSSTPQPAPQLELEDLGDTFRVTAGGLTREYADTTRDCVERVRVAAVFVALALSRAAQPMNDTPATYPTVPAPPQAAVRTEASRWLRLEPHVWLATAPAGGADRAPIGWGGGMHVSVVGRRSGFVAGVAGAAPIQLRMAGVAISELRFPVDAGIRVVWRRTKVDVAFDASVVGAIVSLRAPDVRDAQRKTAFELGVRGSAWAALGHGRVAPFAGAFVEVVPFTHDLALEPFGAVGHTAALWAGAVLGIAVDMVTPW